ncbi:MAG: HAD family hydrolase [SAR202 cluster bacterium]|nr:HAD family hydrolase [SAR202 cluster bacterium]MQF94002.1 HAD family hydrolase [SAR202 cluster bacterium]|tara:strand:- start:924 stop:1724 length:801 start_codon:yes stop_codon:yes gene_type:complete
MIKGLIFDLDDTLTIHDELYDPNYLRIIREFFPDYKNNDSEILKVMIQTIDDIGSKKYFFRYLDCKFGGRDILWADCGGYGEIGEYLQNIYIEAQQEMWKEIFINLGISKNKLNLHEIIHAYKYYMWSGIKAFEDVIPALSKLKDYKLGILTNGMQLHQRKKISKAGLLSFFSKKNSAIVTSSECLSGKPYEIPYKFICEKLELSYSEIIMIGDTLDGDIQGANNLGIKNIWINRKQIKKDQFLEKPSFEINSLEELDKILNQPIL